MISKFNKSRIIKNIRDRDKRSKPLIKIKNKTILRVNVVYPLQLSNIVENV